MTHPQEQLDALVSDIAKRVKVCMYTVVGLISVGAAGMDSHVAMPVTTAGRRGGGGERGDRNTSKDEVHVIIRHAPIQLALLWASAAN